MRLILPCAGLGTRMSMKLNRSKELLINPATGKPLIQYWIDLAHTRRLDPLVITRKEKKDLIKYCKDNKIECQIIKPHGEWPNTVLASNEHWSENNILALPDTVMEDSITALYEIKNQLKLGSQAVLALHFVDDVSKWGSVSNYEITEKSKLETDGWAWGLIGFKREYGNFLFKALNKKNVPYKLKDTSFVYIDSFKDLTRTGKIE